MSYFPSRRDGLAGMCVYSSGDTVAACILGEFEWLRLLGMVAVGGLIYAVEIPAYFRYLDRRFPMPDADAYSRSRVGWLRGALAVAYFNPLWIARHLFFLRVFQQAWDQLDWGLLLTGVYSFFAALPVALLANWMIQTKVPLRWRFTTSALFSAAMAVYYAMW